MATRRTVRKSTPAPKTMFVVAEGVRPNAGALLAAHTNAALMFFGMLGEDRPAVPATYLAAAIGQRAIGYHLKHKNMEHAPSECVRLTKVGREHFVSRAESGRAPQELVDAFGMLFSEGKAAPQTGVGQQYVEKVSLTD